MTTAAISPEMFEALAVNLTLLADSLTEFASALRESQKDPSTEESDRNLKRLELIHKEFKNVLAFPGVKH